MRADRPGRSGVLDIQGIMRLLPHRYPFLLVDRVLELEPPRRALVVKNVTVNEPFFSGHWPGLPIMPGVLILESIAQAAGVLIGSSIENPHTKVAMIASIDRVKLRRPVVPGRPASNRGSKPANQEHRGVHQGARQGERIPGGRSPVSLCDHGSRSRLPLGRRHFLLESCALRLLSDASAGRIGQSS